MNLKDILKNRQGRLLAFFDAILAISITMIALEIDIPEIGSIDAAARYDFFTEVTCYLISFTAMATLWYVHTMFFSNHELTGNAAELVVHLILLFVITLFQPVTRAIGAYPRDLWVRLIYVITFLLMYGLGIAIFIIVRNGEERLAARKQSLREIYSDMRDKIDEENAGKWESLRNTMKPLPGRDRPVREIPSVERTPEEMIKSAREFLPEEYSDMIDELGRQRQKIFRVSVLSTLTMAISISAAVICLMFSIPACYIVLAAGIGIVIAIRMIMDRLYGK